MIKLWTFGCSFTYGDGTLEHDLYRQKYRMVSFLQTSHIWGGRK